MSCSSSDYVSNRSGEVKTGYLRRYGGWLFKSWKKKMFVLHKDNQLTWSDSYGDSVDGHINIRTECTMLKVGAQLQREAPTPEKGCSIQHMFSLTWLGKTCYIQTENESELVSWLTVLYQAKGIPPPNQQPPPPHGHHQPVAPGVTPGMPPPPGFHPNVTSQGQPPGYSAQQGYPPQAYPPPQGYHPPPRQQQGYPPQGYHSQGHPQPRQQQPRQNYPRQQGGASNNPQTIVVNNDNGRRNDSFATGMLTGYMLGGYGHYGYGYGWGHAGYHHGFGHHDHHTEINQEVHQTVENNYYGDEGAHGGDNYGGEDYGGEDYGGNDYGGDDYGGDDYGGDNYGGDDYGGDDCGGDF